MEVHLPCPALAEWLPTLLAQRRVAAWAPKSAPRSLRSTLALWPAIEAEPREAAPAVQVEELEALVLGVRLGRPELPEACLRRLRPGTQIVELAVSRPPLLRRLLGLDDRPLPRALASQARTLQWLARGCFDLQQWESVEPHGVVVTLARLPAHPMI